MLSDLSNTSLTLSVDDGSKEVLDGDTNSPILAVAKKETEKRVQREVFKKVCQLDLKISSRIIASKGIEMCRRRLGFLCTSSIFLAPLIMILMVSSVR